MNRIKKLGREFTRVLFDGTLLCVIFLILCSGMYQKFTFAEQTYFGKMLLVSTGFVLAHITRKLAFPSVNWLDDNQKMLKALIIALYVVYIYAYAMGG